VIEPIVRSFGIDPGIEHPIRLGKNVEKESVVKIRKRENVQLAGTLSSHKNTK